MYKTVSVARAKLFFANYKKKCAARAKLFFLLITSVVVVFYHSLPLSLVLLDFVFSCLLPPPTPSRQRCKFDFLFAENDRSPLQKSETSRKNRNQPLPARIETLPIFQICPRSSQTIGNIYDFEFSWVGKIWEGREIVKSPIVCDFPDIWKPGINISPCLRNNCIREIGLLCHRDCKLHI